MTAKLVTGAAAALLVMGGGALAQERVSFGTNWLPQAEHGGFYQAVADGTYEVCGLEVEIVPGGPQVNNRALLMAGRLDFYMGGNLLFAFSAIEQGIPFRVVAATFQKDPQILITHPGQGFDRWEDLPKLEKVFVGDEGFHSFYQWMIDEYGFTEEQRAPYTFNPGPFLADKKSGQQGYLTSEPFAIVREGGFEPNVFLLADYGFDTYASTVEAMQQTIDERPEVVQCFVDGSAIGWTNYLYGDPSAANALIQAANPDMTDEQIAYSIGKLKEHGIVDSGEAPELGIGAMVPERFESFYGKMVSAGVVKDGLDVTQAYTLDFVNKGVGLDRKKELLGK